MAEDIRWQQRFANYQLALQQLETFFEPPALNDRERQGLIEDGETWMLMIQDRNLTSHTYNRSTAEAIAANIVDRYLPCFKDLHARLQQRQVDELGEVAK